MRRGEIYYVSKSVNYGSEQEAGRPAIIVSNDVYNASSDVCEIVYLTTSAKRDLPTHVTIRSTHKVSTALCEQITSVSFERIGDRIAKCTDSEMEAVDRALEISLGIKAPAQPTSRLTTFDNQEFNQIRTERDLYKDLYDKLLKTIIK